MLSPPLVLGASFAYLLLLFGVAYWADSRAVAGRSVIGNAWVYTLSMGVYCTAWTYFGSIGRAAASGLWFLPIHLGPTLAMLLAGSVLRKAIASGLALLTALPGETVAAHVPWWGDSTLYIALVLAGFTVAFGTRHLDTTERHEGLVAAIAAESVVKLVAFLAVGIFVCWGLFDGLGDIFARAGA